MAVQITPLPTPPTRQDPANFSARGDAFLGALPLFQTELNDLALSTEQSVIDAAASAEAAALSETAVEADRLQVAANTATVATNTNTVVARADEVATNTSEVANNTLQVAADAQAVADALDSIADGPVASVAGLSGVVTAGQLNMAMLAYMQANTLSFQ